MKRRSLVAVVSLLAGFSPSIALLAQANPAAAASAGPEAATDVGKYSNFNQLVNRQSGSLRFYGKVEMANGKLPWMTIPVVVTCDGKVQYSTIADPKGGFDIVPPGKSSEVLSQKKDADHTAPTQLIGCAVNAQVEGFTSRPLNIANRTVVDDPSLGTIKLERDEHATGSITSATTESAPPDALKEFEKAHGDDLSGHASSARHHLEKAVSLDPKFAEAWYHLGKLEEADNPAQALSAYQKAVADDPAYLPPYEGIASIAAAQKKWQDAANATTKSLQLDPAGTPEIWYYSAVANFNLGNRTQAETSAETALSMDPGHRVQNTEQMLAVILAARGDYADALLHLRNCLTYMSPGPNTELVKQQVSQLEKVVPPGASK
jgi:tetratricopeptide (TPR) repeat protein